MTHNTSASDDSLTFATDAKTGEPATMPAPPNPQLLAELLTDARAFHANVIAREAGVIERQYRIAQLWLDALPAK